ncbi:unnamed protein product [Brassica rapa subsp. narinosa]|uniref:(rape) hypothetical protein n=1 Tax=Brassica napus TaxID=3708 RepID=A0A816PKB7_BRANA|nr:unnamed protein product [Brassica napus]
MCDQSKLTLISEGTLIHKSSLICNSYDRQLSHVYFFLVSSIS